MDIVYLHEPPTQDNQSEDIYQELCDLDTRGFSYVYDVSNSLCWTNIYVQFTWYLNLWLFVILWQFYGGSMSIEFLLRGSSIL